jgi:hypothetical protein
MYAPMSARILTPSSLAQSSVIFPFFILYMSIASQKIALVGALND